MTPDAKDIKIFGLMVASFVLAYHQRHVEAGVCFAGFIGLLFGK